MVAMVTAGLFAIVAVVFFGWLIIIAGAGVTMHAFWAKRWSGFFLQLFSGLLYLVAGWMLATHGELSAIALTLVIAISFVVQGAFRIGAALSTRIDGWGSLLASGIITLLLGLMIWNEWPLSGVWVIGVFVGIDMFFYGGWVVSFALFVRFLGQAPGARRPFSANKSIENQAGRG